MCLELIGYALIMVTQTLPSVLQIKAVIFLIKTSMYGVLMVDKPT